jgi:hypothetical protein
MLTKHQVTTHSSLIHQQDDAFFSHTTEIRKQPHLNDHFNTSNLAQKIDLGLHAGNYLLSYDFDTTKFSQSFSTSHLK